MHDAMASDPEAMVLSKIYTFILSWPDPDEQEPAPLILGGKGAADEATELPVISLNSIIAPAIPEVYSHKITQTKNNYQSIINQSKTKQN